jgi:hypothetical protein
MTKPNYKQVFAKKKKNEETIKKLCPKAIHTAGIYFIHREQDGFRFGYVGLATKSLLSRLADHLNGYSQHIDLSIRKFGLYDEIKNPYGYKIDILQYCKPNECNDLEQYYIKKYANDGYQLRNSTSGSQGKGKQGIVENKSPKNYRQGVAYGELKTKRKVKEYFDKYLCYYMQEPINVIRNRKYNEFKEWLESDE